MTAVHNAPSACPVCREELLTTRLTCPSCHTEVSGTFGGCRYCKLSEEDRWKILAFERTFGLAGKGWDANKKDWVPADQVK